MRPPASEARATQGVHRTASGRGRDKESRFLFNVYVATLVPPGRRAYMTQVLSILHPIQERPSGNTGAPL
jgi:hypothetical protein